jgi:hypothetical protein
VPDRLLIHHKGFITFYSASKVLKNLLNHIYYLGTLVHKGIFMPAKDQNAKESVHIIERVQTGVRMEKRLLKVLKALSEYLDITLGDLLEGIALHAFDGKAPFSEETRKQINELKKIYGLNIDSKASHRLMEPGKTKQ